MYPELFNKEFLKNVNNYVDLEGAGRKCNTSLFSPYNTLVIGQPLNSQMKNFSCININEIRSVKV